jgi:hypothetical protein
MTVPKEGGSKGWTDAKTLQKVERGKAKVGKDNKQDLTYSSGMMLERETEPLICTILQSR